MYKTFGSLRLWANIIHYVVCSCVRASRIEMKIWRTYLEKKHWKPKIFSCDVVFKKTWLLSWKVYSKLEIKLTRFTCLIFMIIFLKIQEAIINVAVVVTVVVVSENVTGVLIVIEVVTVVVEEKVLVVKLMATKWWWQEECWVVKKKQVEKKKKTFENKIFWKNILEKSCERRNGKKRRERKMDK